MEDLTLSIAPYRQAELPWHILLGILTELKVFWMCLNERCISLTATKDDITLMEERDEIDYHFRYFGKRASDVVYSAEICIFCNTRIDEFGLCGCGTIGGD